MTAGLSLPTIFCTFSNGGQELPLKVAAEVKDDRVLCLDAPREKGLYEVALTADGLNFLPSSS